MTHHRAVTASRLAVTGLAAAAALLVAPTIVDPSPAASAGSSAGTAVNRLVRRHHPAPSHFTQGRVDNPWFPLKPGTRFVYRGVDGPARVSDVMIATYRTKVVDGVTCRVVLDRGFRHGRLTERTLDWYAQTRTGTVWYFGENTSTFDRHGHVLSHAGSFTSGVDGAQAGIFMPAHPHPGPTYRQEFLRGQAEDEFTVLRHGAHVLTPLIASGAALVTKEFSPLEPGVVEHKYYVRDIGDVYDVSVRGETAHARLVSLTHLPRH